MEGFTEQGMGENNHALFGLNVSFASRVGTLVSLGWKCVAHQSPTILCTSVVALQWLDVVVPDLDGELLPVAR